MSRRTLILIVAVICLSASFSMYVIGNKSLEWSEFRYLFWLPLPIAVALVVAARKVENK